MSMSPPYQVWELNPADFPSGGSLQDQLHFLVNFGLLAPSSHNSQPWSFRVVDNTLSILRNPERALLASDPLGRQLFISLGCALENILIAADYYGFTTQVNYFPSKGDNEVVASVTVTSAPSILTPSILPRNNDHLIFSIPKRRVNRNKYDHRLPPPSFLEKVKKVCSSNCSLNFIDNPEQKNQLADETVQGGVEAMNSTAFREELSHYVISNISQSATGMPGFTIGLPTPISLLAPHLIKRVNMNKLGRKKDEALLKKFTPMVGVIGTVGDNPKDWLEAGRTLERVALLAEQEQLATAPLAAAIEIGDHYKKVQTIIGSTHRPQVFFRIGYALQSARHSPRLSATAVTIHNFPEFDGHERVIKIEDRSSGLKGFIAIHNRALGQVALGGTRMFPYLSEEDALRDALRLSRAMTYKCAVAGVAHGGAKGVIIGDPARHKTPALLKAYATKINELGGIFWTGQDVGISESDVQQMLQVSPFFNGKSNLAGDPSPFAALSTFYAMQTANQHRHGSEELTHRLVAVKGVGKVGSELVRLLIEAGAEVMVADINDEALKRIMGRFRTVQVVSSHDIHARAADIFAPCALSNEFNDQTVHEVKASIICGAANNQLARPEIGDQLAQKNIVYVPDFVANAGGLIDIVGEFEPGGYNKEKVLEKIYSIKEKLLAILQEADRKHLSPYRVAELSAELLLKNAVASASR